MNKKLAIKGHATRGKEVIEILEMFGGKNSFYYDGTFKELIYTIGSELELEVFNINSPGVKDGYIVFTLEEFLEKFPYKVGDKALAFGNKCTIIDSIWDGGIDEVVYTIRLDISKYTTTKLSNQLQPYKEQETMEEIIKIDIPKGYEFAGVDDDNQQVVFEKIGFQYPKTYEECCKILNYIPNSYDADEILVYGYMCDELRILQKLLVCRDAYWKIAGEQMGLGKPWEPDWEESDGGYRYCIVNRSNKIVSVREWLGKNYILSFPTEEMRDAFLDSEEIAQLIEICKEFL